VSNGSNARDVVSVDQQTSSSSLMSAPYWINISAVSAQLLMIAHPSSDRPFLFFYPRE